MIQALPQASVRQVERMATSLTMHSPEAIFPRPPSNPHYMEEGEMQWGWLEYSFVGMSALSKSCIKAADGITGTSSN